MRPVTPRRFAAELVENLNATGMLAKMEVAADGSLQSDEGEVGKLKIVRFKDSRQAIKEGANLFSIAPINIEPVPDARVMQGGLEQSNVSLIDGMVGLGTLISRLR